MAIRMTGMISNLDTDTIVQELMKAQSARKANVENDKTKLEWKMDKWDELNTKTYSLYTDHVSKLKLQGSYLAKNATSSNEVAVKVTASNTTANGSYTVNVDKVASSQFVTGRDISEKEYTKETKLVETGMQLGSELIVNAGTNYNKVKRLEITEDTTIADFVRFFKEAGLNAEFNEKQGRFIINATESGAENRFTLTNRTVNSEIKAAEESLRGLYNYDELDTDKKNEVDSAIFALRFGTDDEKAEALSTLTSSLVVDTGANEAAVVAAVTALQGNIATDTSSAIDAEGEGLEKLGLGEITRERAENGFNQEGDANRMSVLGGSDSEIRFNGAKYTSSSSSFSINGMSINVSDVTASAVRVNVAADSESAYTAIKDFIGQYNELIDALSGAFNAKSAKGYDMLTKDEKNAMTEKEVELWENKIKDSLLRRDENLSTLMSSFREALASEVEIDGKKYSLSTFGVVTGDYTESGKLHIYGDKDEPKYNEKTNTLRNTLAEDPETSAKALSAIMNKLYEVMNKKMASSKLSSAMTFYNDKQMKTQVESYEKDITKWEDKLADIEDRYYKQFSSMESAMAKMQSQQSAVDQLANMSTQRRK